MNATLHLCINLAIHNFFMCILLKVLKKFFVKVFRFLCFVFYFAIAACSPLRTLICKRQGGNNNKIVEEGLKKLRRENNKIVEGEGNKNEKGEG